MTTPATDEALMQRAVTLARMAWGQTHPNPLVGAVIVEEGVVVAEGFHARDGTAHAERVALPNLGRPPKKGATLYVTLEPCVMCAGAMMHARLARVVYGAPDPKTGACGSVVNLFEQEKLNHHTEVRGGVMAEECGALLKEFFAERRRAAQRLIDQAAGSKLD